MLAYVWSLGPTHSSRVLSHHLIFVDNFHKPGATTGCHVRSEYQ